MRTRRLNVMFERCARIHGNELIELAHELCNGTHEHNQLDTEDDETFIDRIAEEYRIRFLRSAGLATGADGFAFGPSFAD